MFDQASAFAFGGSAHNNGPAKPSSMWYFAYGSNLNGRAVAEWCRHYGHRAPPLRQGKPAILENYRLCFPIYNLYWGGGTADIVYDPGKYVCGVLFDLSEGDLRMLDQKVERRLEGDREIGVYKRIDVTAAPYGKGLTFKAMTYQGVSIEKNHIPPTRNYMDLVIQGAYANGLSMMWISYLQSFTVQGSKSPKPPAAEPTAPVV
jgi:hypothetical protein